MKKAAIALCLVAILCLGANIAWAQNDVDAQIMQLKQQLDNLQKQIDDLQKAQSQKETSPAVQATISNVAKLKKIKVSGYVQARYESYNTPGGVADTGDNRAPDNRFYVRRGRFKITGQPTNNSIGVVQLDISGYDRTRVESKDLYLEYHPWGVGARAPFFLRMGQMNWPFGYVIERSSTAREVPERPKVFAGTTVNLPTTPFFNGLFPGERDKGICMFNTEGSKAEWAMGLFNGTGTKAGDPGASFLENGGRFEDNNTGKVLVGRIRYPFTDNFHWGTSLYSGTQAVRTVSNAPAAVMVEQTRWGTDFQYYLHDASIKGEYVTGKEPYYSNTTITPNGTSGTNRTVSGWYLTGVKNIGPKHQAVAQYDVLDDKAMATTFGKLTTWNLGFIRFLDDATRLKLFYEINNEEKNSVSNNGLRVEMITVF
ncbi:MAG: porin [Armatimonadota bacterium]|nr:hypothetical protein [bacterium]